MNCAFGKYIVFNLLFKKVLYSKKCFLTALHLVQKLDSNKNERKYTGPNPFIAGKSNGFWWGRPFTNRKMGYPSQG